MSRSVRPRSRQTARRNEQQESATVRRIGARRPVRGGQCHTFGQRPAPCRARYTADPRSRSRKYEPGPAPLRLISATSALESIPPLRNGADRHVARRDASGPRRRAPPAAADCVSARVRRRVKPGRCGDSQYWQASGPAFGRPLKQCPGASLRTPAKIVGRRWDVAEGEVLRERIGVELPVRQARPNIIELRSEGDARRGSARSRAA